MVAVTSTVPVVRAGLRNNLIVIWLIWVVLLYQAGRTLSLPDIVTGLLEVVVTVGFVCSYLSSISRIRFYRDTVVFTRAVDELAIRRDAIEWVRIVVYRAWWTTKIRVKVRGRWRPRGFAFIAFSTNYGPLEETATILRRKFEERGIVIR